MTISIEFRRFRSRRDFLKLSSLLLTSAAFGGLAACESELPLPIASHLYAFIFLTHNMGWVDPQDVVILETRSASESLKALAEHKALGAALTLHETLGALQQGIPLSVVLLCDVSAGANALTVKPHIKSLGELKGARIGVETGALGALLLKKVLQKAALKVDDVEVMHINFGNQLKVWEKDALDALFTYQPISGKIEQTGAIRLFGSDEIPNTIFDVLAIRSDITQDYGRQIRALISGHFQALQAWKANPVDTTYRLANDLKIDATEIPRLYRKLDLPNLIYNRHLLSAPTAELMNVAKDLAGVMDMQTEIIKPDLFRTDYLPEH